MRLAPRSALESALRNHAPSYALGRFVSQPNRTVIIATRDTSDAARASSLSQRACTQAVG